MYRIPFNRPFVVGPEYKYISEAAANGHLSGDGPFTQRCSSLLERLLGVRRALPTTSCTHALELAALLLNVRPGDEVIVPSFTFVSTANAFVLRGARPVFVDSRSDTLNVNEDLIPDLVGPRTRAIVVVHYAGVGCAMDSILELARKHSLAVVEDNAHGLFGRYRDQWLGTFGSLSALSFHETKNVTCGEGGALLINDPEHIDRAEILREKGTDRSRFFRGEVDKYTWVDVGSSYLLSELLAAFLYGQLEAWQLIQSRRRAIWERYATGLAGWAADRGARLPVVPAECEQSYHLFYVLMPSVEARQNLMEHLRLRSILSVFHYIPLHLSPMGRRFGGRPGACPVAEDLGGRLVRLPLYTGLTGEDQDAVIEAMSCWQG